MRVKIGILDDYQNVALKVADWTGLADRAELTVFTDHISDIGELVARLADFDVLCVMRERTLLNREVLEQLPRLKLIVSTGTINAAIDTRVTEARGVEVAYTGYSSTPTIELTWALILALARNLVVEVDSVRAGGWQRSIGVGLHGKTLGILGLGRIGTEVARVGLAFGMQVVSWSQNLTIEDAAAKGVSRVEKAQLFECSDFLAIHTILSKRTRGLVDSEMIGKMKRTAYLLNMSRGQIVDEKALIDALTQGRIAGAGIDAFNIEPLPADHPFRCLPNILATPHLGYVTADMYRTFYGDSVLNIETWMDRQAAVLKR